MNEEITLAIEELRQRPSDQAWFIPVLLDDCEVPRRNIGAGEDLSDLQAVRLFQDWTDGISRILAVVQPISSVEFSLRQALRSTSARSRITALDSLGKMGPTARESIPNIIACLSDENETARAAAAEALGKIGFANEEVVTKLLELTPSDGHPYYPAKHANQALIKIGVDAVPYLIGVLSENGAERNTIGESALRTLSEIGEAAIPALQGTLRDGDRRLQSLATRAIAGMNIAPKSDTKHTSETRDQLIRTLLDNEEAPEQDLRKSFEMDSIRADAADALAVLGDFEAVPALVKALEHPNYVCVAAALALGRLGDSAAIQPLIAVLQDDQKFWVPRGAAAVALGMMGSTARPALDALKEALKFEKVSGDEKWDERAREAVEDAILRINDPKAESRLTGKGYRYEMWGIY